MRKILFVIETMHQNEKQPQAMTHHLGRVVNNINVFFFLHVNCLIDLNNLRIHIIA